MSYKTEQMLSDMAREAELADAKAEGLTVEQLREKRRNCKHVWRSCHYYDICDNCGEGRA